MSDDRFDTVPERFVTPATRRGWCPICKTHINPPEAITKYAGVWMHENCADEVEPTGDVAA